MQRNDLKSAERYLTKAGDSGEAQYARAILAAKQGAKEEAVKQAQQYRQLRPRTGVSPTVATRHG